MVEPNPNLQETIKLESFKDEIRRVKDKDKTMLRVEDVAKLLPEDMGFWEHWKKWIQSLEDFLGNFSLDQLEENKSQFQTLLNNLISFAGIVDGRTRDGDKNRSEFAAWLNNLIGGFRIPLDAFVEPDVLADPPNDLNMLKRALAEIRANMS